MTASLLFKLGLKLSVVAKLLLEVRTDLANL